MGYTVLALVFIAMYFFFDTSRYKLFASGTSILVFFYGLSLDLHDSPDMDPFFRYIKPKLDEIVFSYYFITLIALLICNILVYFFYDKTVYEKQSKIYSNTKLVRAFYLLSGASFIGLLINLYHVYASGNTIAQMALDPRTYEYTFGKSVIINYIYFLNIPAILTFIYIRQVQNIKVKFGRFIVAIMFIASGFHGIKYTIFDTILIPLMFFLLINNKVKFIYSFLVIGFLGIIYILFSSFIRGGYYDSQLMNIAAYILPNYYNLFYNIQTHQDQFTPFFNILVPDKLHPIFPEFLHFNKGVGSEYSINPSYNMYTSLDFLYTDFNLLGPFFYIFIYLATLILYNRKFQNIIIVYILASIFYNLNMSFYTYAFIKIKYSYYIIVFILVHVFSQKNEKSELTIDPIST